MCDGVCVTVCVCACVCLLSVQPRRNCNAKSTRSYTDHFSPVLRGLGGDNMSVASYTCQLQECRNKQTLQFSQETPEQLFKIN